LSKANTGDLCNSGHRSVIPYIHGRILYCNVCGVV
jgi:hypothetical protein